jgi:hypothetical protein
MGAAAMVTPPAAVVEGLDADVVGDVDAVFFFDELPQAAVVSAMTATNPALDSQRREFRGDVITCRSYERRAPWDFSITDPVGLAGRRATIELWATWQPPKTFAG